MTCLENSRKFAGGFRQLPFETRTSVNGSQSDYCLDTQQEVRVELLPSGERASQQLWSVPRGARHLDRTDRLQRPTDAGEADGRGGRGYEPQPR